ncbi:hypothetical protein GCM10010462_22130 [Microbacterium dextranolyticum]|uniref:Uncharacterized protein n=1 Tax=Microbacterium dextranolyticum TaxID=36806 RepID=A0A9W6HQB3_9MICO|nr:hypothetical protein GCM10017591_27930 [Microbacterium dextranolyticum]
MGAWRAWLSAICLIVAAILVPVSIVGAWARAQLVDEDAFVATLAPLSSDADVRQMIVDETMRAITTQTDFGALTSDVIDAVASLGLPASAVSALDLLKEPAAAGLEGIVRRGITDVVDSDRFSEIWATTLRTTHRALVTAATSDGGGLVVRTEDGVGIQMGEIVSQVRQGLQARDARVARLIPQVDHVIVLGDGQSLQLLRSGYGLVVAAGWWLPFPTIGLFVLGVLLARRRTTALLGAGVALLVGGIVLVAGIAIGSAAVSTAASGSGLSPAGLGAVYGLLSEALSRTAVVTAFVGAVVAALAWSRSGGRTPSRLRMSLGALNAEARRALALRGLDTGAFGAWLFRHPTAIGVMLLVLAIVWLALLRPLTLGDAAGVFAVLLITWWLSALLQRRPDERGDDSATERG